MVLGGTLIPTTIPCIEIGRFLDHRRLALQTPDMAPITGS